MSQSDFEFITLSEYKKILNDQEIAELERYAEVPTLQSAIHKVLLYQIYYKGTLKPGENPDPGFNFAMLLAQASGGITHEHLGADLRTKVQALQLLEDGVKTLGRFKKAEVKSSDDTNPAR